MHTQGSALCTCSMCGHTETTARPLRLTMATRSEPSLPRMMEADDETPFKAKRKKGSIWARLADKFAAD